MEVSTKKQLTLIIIFMILSAALGYSFGFIMGAQHSMIYLLSLSKHFIDDIDFDEEKVAAGLYAYEHQINNCFRHPNLTNGNN